MKDKIIKFIKRLPCEVSRIFSIMMIVFFSMAFINGVEKISVCRIGQLLAIAILGGSLIIIAFSDIFLKKIPYIFRICTFIVPFFFISLVFALSFSWISVENLINWIVFIAIFLFCFLSSIIIYLITVKIKGKEYTEKLIEYQNRDKGNK